MRLRPSIVVGLVAAALAAGAGGVVHTAAPQAANATDTSLPRLENQTFTLKNGLKVIFSQDKRLPMVAVNLWYHVGPANETPGRTGFAHLFEHMMFQGSKHVESDTHFKLLESAGASDINGSTNRGRGFDFSGRLAPFVLVCVGTRRHQHHQGCRDSYPTVRHGRSSLRQRQVIGQPKKFVGPLA